MQQALYRKYRPAKFSDVVGQEPIKLTLANQVRLGKLGHAYLFSGPKGTGKTTVARILAKAVNCMDTKDGEPCGVCDLCVAADAGSMIDLIEMDAASHTGVDDMREVISATYTVPAMGKYKVYVIDEAHMLSKSAFNALLKTLEEPPEHVIFVLASTEIDKFPPTIVSRCQRFDFRPIRMEDIESYLADIAKRESIDTEEKALRLIAQQSGGGMRDALSLLERAAAIGTQISAAKLTDWFGWLDWWQVLELSQLVVEGKRAAAFEKINRFVVQGYDLLTIAKQWTELVSHMLMAKLDIAIERPADEAEVLKGLAQSVSKDVLIWWLEQMLDLPYRVRSAVLPQLPFELLVIKVAERLHPQTAGESAPTISTPFEPGAEAEKIVAVREEAASSISTQSASEIDWPAVSGWVSQQSPTLGAVLAGASFQLADGKLEVQLTNNFHKQKLEQPQVRDMVLAALQRQGIENINLVYAIDERVREDAQAVDASKVMEIFG